MDMKIGMALGRFRKPSLGALPDPFAGVQVGDEVGGGIYIGVRLVNGVDHHYIASKSDGLAELLQWGSYGIITGATSFDDGLFNQQNIIDNHINASYEAFHHCINYRGGGNEDWYLPARNESLFMASATSGMVEFASHFQTSSVYTWTSTQGGGNTAQQSSQARAITYGTQQESARDKRSETYFGTPMLTRPIRRVPV